MDTVKQGSLNKPFANSDDFHNEFSLRRTDTMKQSLNSRKYRSHFGKTVFVEN